ncbi:MAG: tellurite resistance TerB family protein [Gammaproteobacteria bacterium]|nr:tellurite resistance TerB family protein [Gammaproteobacteria bacterium]
MDAKAFIDDLITSARKLSTQGRNLAEDKLGVPAQGSERDAMLDGMGKGALAAGALAILLGTGVGRRVAGSAIKLGGLAAVGAVAYKAYQNWQSNNPQAGGAAVPVDTLDAAPLQARSELLLEAMIAAAMADGHVDADERARIGQQLAELGLEQDVERFIATRVSHVPSTGELAAKADSIETAAEVYLVTRLLIDDGNPRERAYLEELVSALGLDPAMREELERQARAV